MNNREAATLIYVCLMLALTLYWPTTRGSLTKVARAFFRVKIVGPFLLYLALLTGCIAVAARIGIWTTDLVTPTAFWFVLTGFVLLVNISDVVKQEHYFRKVALRTIGAAAFVEVFSGLKPFYIVIELLMLPLVTFLACLSVVAARDPKQLPAKRLVDVLLGLIGISVLLFTARSLFNERATLDGAALLRQFVLPIWLSALSIPFVYLLSLYAEYENAFIRLKLGNDQKRPSLQARTAVALELLNDHRLLHRMTTYWGGRIATAPTLAAARQEVRSYRDAMHARDAKIREKQDGLIRNEGLPGSDSDGRRYDRREFKETTDALQWLASCHMGWHNRLGKYRDDLLNMLGDFERQGLPPDHGITMHVREDGQAWYAYRTTATGWVFGMGANGTRPDQRFYDGPVAPSGFPGPDGSWGQQAHEQSPNWSD